jgi:hypothetical protein
MHLQISYLDIMEDLTNVVDQSLNSPDPPRGVRWIDLHWVGTRGLLVPGTRGHLQELGPGGVLAVETQSGLRDLGPGSSLVELPGPLREPGPDLGFGAQGGLRELGPGSLLIT